MASLEAEQEQLFMQLVEASRSVPRSQREPFMFIRTSGPDLVQGNGFSTDVLHEDLLVLQSAGLLEVSDYHDRGSGFNFFIPPNALAYYEKLKSRAGTPPAQVEQEVLSYLDAAEFQEKYLATYSRWTDATELLWHADSDRELSTIGHKCREAIQEFVTALIERHSVSGANPDKAKTLLGEAKYELLDALFDYWKVVGDLVQRQEHAGQREGEPLLWEDGRRVVFQTAIVVFEIDRAL